MQMSTLFPVLCRRLCSTYCFAGHKHRSQWAMSISLSLPIPVFFSLSAFTSLSFISESCEKKKITSLDETRSARRHVCDKIEVREWRTDVATLYPRESMDWGSFKGSLIPLHLIVLIQRPFPSIRAFGRSDGLPWD